MIPGVLAGLSKSVHDHNKPGQADGLQLAACKGKEGQQLLSRVQLVLAAVLPLSNGPLHLHAACFVQTGIQLPHVCMHASQHSCPTGSGAGSSLALY